MEEISTEVAVSVKSFDSMCRTCLCDLKEKIAFNLDDFLVEKHDGTTENTELLAIREVLSKCTSIQINAEDTLPKNLCEQCLTELTHAHEFIKKCQKSEETLRTTSLKCNEEITEIQTIEPDNLSPETENNNVVVQPDTKPATKKTETRKPYCDSCCLLFASFDEFREHRKRKHSTAVMHACPQCPKKYSIRAKLVEHIRTHTKERPYSCNLCPAKFNNNFNLRRHGLIHSGEKHFNCERCSKAFSTKYALQAHIRAHTGEKPFICNHCGKLYKHFNFLNKHIKALHEPNNSDSTNKTCSICKLSLSSEEALKLHKEKVHKQFLCSECGGRYASKYSLELHYRVHTNEKPFVCDYCGKCFKTPSVFRSHRYTHTGEKPYGCEVCDKRFKQSAHLKMHQITQHSKERPYACKFCAKGYAVSSVLKVHERTHTGERPYKCDLCEKGFYDVSSRNKHMETHTHVRQVKKVKEDKTDL